jgi:hypothetical protein
MGKKIKSTRRNAYPKIGDGTLPRRFARTPDNILVALGFEPSRQNKLKLKYWQVFEDWPKKGKNGFDIAELKAFLDRHFDEFLADSKRAKGIEQGDKFSSGDMKLLRSSGQRMEDGGLANQINGDPEVMGYAGVAEVLSRHFQVPVSKMDISDWCHGKRLDHGVPNFPPPKASGRFNKLECVNWFKQFKFSDPRATATPDLFKKLENERATGELERLEHERLMRAVERSQYIEKAEHNRILASLGNLGRNTLWDLFDRTAYDRFDDCLTGHGLPEEWRQLVMAELRKLNPELLLKFAAAVSAEVQANQREIEPNKKTA